MITLSHPTGNAFVRHALSAFERAELLESFYTTVAWPFSFGPQTLQRRHYPIAWNKIHTRPTRELLRLCGVLPHSIDAVYTDLDKYVSHQMKDLQGRGTRALYAYEDGAHESFTTAKLAGIHTLYDLPIGHYSAAQKLFAEEAQLEPEWAPTLTGLQDSEAKLDRKAAELSMADHVIVASSFTAQTLEGHLRPDQKLSVISYGTTTGLPFHKRLATGPLKILYVGSLTQRKGLSYLFKALAALPKGSYSLTVVGRAAADCPALRKALVPHVYIPTLPHGHILDFMRGHDILVFPSLFEGFGLVLTEALSCGLPFIATPHTAAPDLITHGQEGFIVPIRSANAIAEKLTWALENRPALATMQEAAYTRAQTLGWLNYENSLINLARTYAA
mgnify:CR=1 FL=1